MYFYYTVHTQATVARCDARSAVKSTDPTQSASTDVKSGVPLQAPVGTGPAVQVSLATWTSAPRNSAPSSGGRARGAGGGVAEILMLQSLPCEIGMRVPWNSESEEHDNTVR